MSHPMRRGRRRKTAKSKRGALQSGLAALALVLVCGGLWLGLRRTEIPQRAPSQAWTVETEKPKFCVHTLLENEVEEAKVVRSLVLAREMGASAIVQFFPWAYFQPRAGSYDWERADLLARAAKTQGLRVIARLGLTPGWARDEGTTLNALPDGAFADFAEAAGAFAGRYAGQIDHIIIWNEPNLSFEWGYEPVDPRRYARLLELTYPAVKRENPDAVVLAGALAPTLEAARGDAGWNERDFLRAMYAAGAGDHFDALAIHSYGFREIPEAAPAWERLNYRRAELLRAIMLEQGDAHKPAFITEMGWNDHPRWTGAVRASQRTAYTIRALDYAEEHWAWAENVCLWALRYPADLGRHPDYFTLASADFVLKPIYFALQAYARGWEGSETLWLPPPSEA